VLAAGERAELAACPFFTLELIVGGKESIAGDTADRTFHALTVIDGAAEVVARDGALRLNRFDSAMIPAACGAYKIKPLDGCRLLKASTV